MKPTTATVKQLRWKERVIKSKKKKFVLREPGLREYVQITGSLRLKLSGEIIPDLSRPIIRNVVL